jgi:hypothetical protein
MSFQKVSQQGYRDVRSESGSQKVQRESENQYFHTSVTF